MCVLAAAVWFKLIGGCMLLVPAAFGSFLLFGSADRLYSGVSWMPLPLPEKDTLLHRLLLTLWRFIGIIVLLSTIFMAYILLFQMQ
jgi:hypothetical protein